MLVGLFSAVISLAETNSNGSFADQLLFQPELTGPDQVCVIFGSVLADFSGGGNPATDVYNWTILNPNGSEHFSRSGGATFQTISVQFSEVGVYTVNLSVRRGNDIIYSGSKTLQVIQGPELALQPDYLLCDFTPATLTAVNPDNPNLSNYAFEWRNMANEVIASSNEISVLDEGFYFVTISLANQTGAQSCLVNGTTYVGQPIDFQLNISNTTSCESEIIEITVDTPLIGEWEIQKEGESDWINFGKAYSLSINTGEELMGPGQYTAVFKVNSDRYPNCVSIREIAFEVNPGPDFEIRDIVAASDCTTPNGQFIFQSNSPIDFLSVRELSLQYSNIGIGEILVFENLLPGIYNVEIRANSCDQNRVIIVPNANPPAPIQFELIETGETCTASGRENGSVLINFLNGSFSGTYRVVNSLGENFASGTISNENNFEISLPGGFYALEIVSSDSCVLPENRMVEIYEESPVSFSVPFEMIICDSFDFIPETNQNLNFTLIDPSGQTHIRNSGDPFNLTLEGNYTITGRSNSNPSVGCDFTREFRVIRVDAPEFDPVLASADCFGNRLYRAELYGEQSFQYVIRWYDADFNIVGRNEIWYPTGYGTFYLDVQPRGSSPCAFNPKPLVVREPVFEVDVTLEGSLICPEQPGSINLITDFEEVFRIEWIYIADDGTQNILSQLENEREIMADSPGTYEAVVFNEANCEIGRNMIMVFESPNNERPNINPFYSVCETSNYGEVVDPGIFASYEWYFQGEFIGNDSKLALKRAGNYRLVVTNEDGCSFESTFSTFEDCTFQYIFPTGMELKSNEKLFELYVNDAVEEAKLWIYNRQGELIHFCEGQNIQSRVAFCHWDGTSKGRRIPPGTYTVVLNIVSNRFELDRKFTSKLVVLD
ncbi:hypothetical protein [Shivajiella indica]|uniref:Uncharacterized protein n=1 Tax=Shivajiella indica TaxID=872115 RepID=A0ABW5B7J9_9BACT